MKTVKLNNGVMVVAKPDGQPLIATNRTTASKQHARLAAHGIKTVVIQPRMGPVFYQAVEG